MKYTHILMPKKAFVFEVQEFIDGQHQWVRETKSWGLLEAFIARNCHHAKMIIFNTEHNGIYLNPSEPFIFRELPQDAQEFPFGNEVLDSVVGESELANSGTIDESSARIVSYLDDEIPF